MCICINCLFIKNCKTYSFIQEKHGLINLTKLNDKFLTPNQTIIKNEIQYFNYQLEDWDVKECSNFVENPGSFFNEK